MKYVFNIVLNKYVTLFSAFKNIYFPLSVSILADLIEWEFYLVVFYDDFTTSDDVIVPLDVALVDDMSQD